MAGFKFLIIRDNLLVGWVTPANPASLAGAGITGFNSCQSERAAVTRTTAMESSPCKAPSGRTSTTRLPLSPVIPASISRLIRSATSLFNGVASDVFRSSFSNGIQGDGSYRLNDAHTIRMGFFANNEDITSDNTSTLFTQDPNTGNVTLPPYQVVDNQQKNGNTLCLPLPSG